MNIAGRPLRRPWTTVIVFISLLTRQNIDADLDLDTDLKVYTPASVVSC